MNDLSVRLIAFAVFPKEKPRIGRLEINTRQAWGVGGGHSTTPYGDQLIGRSPLTLAKRWASEHLLT